MEQRRPTYRPPAPPSPTKYPRIVYWRRRLLVALSGALVVLLIYLGISFAVALTNQSYGASLSSRSAEWGRQHGFGFIVTWAENEYYSLHKPKKGGKPPKDAFTSGVTTITVPKGTHLPVPTTVKSPAGTNLPGEGEWHPVGRLTAKGIPAIYETDVRVDPVHTSYVAGLAWMDPKLLSAQLYSGSFIPGGGPYKYSAPITSDASKSLVAAFNAGFRIQDSQAGYYTDGKYVAPLRKGAASVVILKDGLMEVGEWGRDFNMGTSVASVRQNLDLIVDKGKVVKGLDASNSAKWGTVIGNSIFVWRSGIGETADGALVYVGGPSLTVRTLAIILQHAGCIRAMELDINADWVQYSTYSAPYGQPVTGANGTKLLPSMIESPARYFATWMNRDFFTMSLRSSPSTSATTTTTSG